MEYPFKQAKHFYKGGNEPALIIVHDMEFPERPTGAEWCADFFAGPNAPKASAHFCVDNDSVVQCVLEEDGAWHTPGALPAKGGREINRSSIGIEHAGYARQTADEWRDAYSTAMLELSAELVADLCKLHDIPIVKLSPDDLRQPGARGICGHVDCTKATGVGSHWDPGPHFPWDWYLARVRHHAGASTGAGLPDSSTWPRVACGGVTYAVAPIYIPFVGIGQAADLAARLGCELPTPALVDAIWRAADLRIDAGHLMRSDHDGTAAGMSSEALLTSQTERLERAVSGRSLGVDFVLLAGAFKDVVREDGRLGIYGWHRLDGRPIQPFYTGHARGWVDYSQGLRLVRPV